MDGGDFCVGGAVSLPFAAGLAAGVAPACPLVTSGPVGGRIGGDVGVVVPPGWLPGSACVGALAVAAFVGASAEPLSPEKNMGQMK